jgi:hypothetical protein
MIRDGADTKSSGTEARAATPGPVLWLKLGMVKTRQPELPHAGDGKADQGANGHSATSTQYRRACVANVRGERQPILNEW